MKRIVSLVLSSLLAVVLLASCSLTDLLSGGAPTGDELYSKLSYLITSPTSVDGDELLRKQITFTAYIYTDPETMDFDEDGSQRYVYAAIARNSSDFLLNVDGVETRPEAGKYYSITGSVEGYIYGTVDNEQIEILDIKAKELTEVNPSFDLPEANNSVDVNGSNYNFLNAYSSTDVLGSPVVILTFDHTNNSDKEVAPDIDSFFYYVGDYSFSSTIFSIDSDLIAAIDSTALEASWTNKTQPGKTQRYYVTLSIDSEETEIVGDALEAELYDDDFNITHFVNIPLEAAPLVD